MEMEITLPAVIPAMTLPGVAFFPQALMPLHIFETRYREMLRDALASDRLFAVAGLDATRAAREPDQFEPSHHIATVGIIRACQKQANGTSHLLLQGLARVEFTHIVADEPYRRVGIRALASVAPTDAAATLRQRDELVRLLSLKRRLGVPLPRELAGFLRHIDDPAAFVDIAAFSACADAAFKQRLLETLDIAQRLTLFAAHLRAELADIRLRRKLQGRLTDEHIADN